MVKVTTWSRLQIIDELVLAKTVTLREASCENSGLVDFYFQMYDANSIPAPGSTDMKFTSIRIPPGQRFAIVFDNKNYPNGFVFSNGLYACASSTKYSKTPIGLTSMCLEISYEENTR